VEVDLGPRDGHLVFEVRDDGAGIREEYRRRVFEQGFQVPGSLPGTGLGLYSVAQAAANHDGAVEIDDAPGGGTVLRVVLPAD
jgi:signal transduction histidine kinase